MGRKTIFTEEEIEEKRDEYNRLIIRENNLLTSYPTAPRLNRTVIAKQLRDVAAQLYILETHLDRHSKH